MEEKKRILITGVSGLLGNNLPYSWQRDNHVLGLYHEHKVAIEGVSIQSCDLAESRQIKNIVNHFAPDVVIHCAAISNIDACEKNPDQAYAVNVTGTENVLAALNGINTKLVYISTDNFYRARMETPLSEEADVDSLNVYGKTKIEAEEKVSTHHNTLILRTNFFGWNIQNKFSLAEWFIHELRLGHHLKGFDDAVFSSIYTLDLAEILLLAINKDLKGIYNLGSRTSLSKYAFALKIAECFGLDKDLVEPISVTQSKLPAQRRGYLALDVGKIETDLGVTLPTLDQSVEHFYEDYTKGLPVKIKADYYPQMDILSYGRQMIDENDIQAVVDVLRSSHLTQGDKVREFEDALQAATEAPFCVAVNTGTSALHLACLAAGIQEGDEVITSPNSFVASANCVVYCGGTPVFADIDPRTYNITAPTIEKKMTPKTKAVIAVHFAGQSCDMKSIQALVRRKEKEYGHKIYIIEDAAHALGSRYEDTAVGSCAYSDMAAMSFHPVKHVTTGEGGALFTKDETIYRSVKFFSSHGITSDEKRFVQPEDIFKGKNGSRKTWYYEQQFLGYNFRITDIQCALGLSQLRKLPWFMKRRREIVDYYNRAFDGVSAVTIPHETLVGQSNFHLYVLLIDFAQAGLSREQFMAKLLEAKIRTQVHYIPIYTQPFYQGTFGLNPGLCPRMEEYYKQCLSIPLYPGLTPDDIERVVDRIKDLACGKK